MRQELFRRHFGTEADTSLLESVLRAHLWIDSLLSDLIRARVEYPDVLELDRTSFAARVTWAQALGFIDPADAPWYRALNRVRNRLAHQLGSEPTEEDIADVIATLQGRSSVMADEVIANEEMLRSYLGGRPDAPSSRLKAAMIMHITWLDHQILLANWRRTNAEGLRRVSARSVLDRIRRELSGLGEQDREDAMRDWRQAEGVPEPPEYSDVFARPSKSSTQQDGDAHSASSPDHR